VTSRSHRRWQGRLPLLTVAVASLLVAGPAGAVAAAQPPTPYGVNLVRNPGAEAGPAGDGASVVPIPHWKTSTKTDYFTVVPYGATDFPTHAESRRIDGGKQFFSCGDGTSEGSLGQLITLTGRTAAISHHHVRLVLKAHIATFGTVQLDEGWVSVYFDGTPINHVYPLLGSVDSGHITRSNGVFKVVTAAGKLPKGTAVLAVVLNGLRDASGGGSYCDAYFDNIDVRLKHV